jgi:hypothetical protein
MTTMGLQILSLKCIHVIEPFNSFPNIYGTLSNDKVRASYGWMKYQQSQTSSVHIIYDSCSNLKSKVNLDSSRNGPLDDGKKF